MYSVPKQGTQGPGEGPGHVSAARAGALSAAGVLGRMLHIIQFLHHLRCNIYIQLKSIYPFVNTTETNCSSTTKNAK